MKKAFPMAPQTPESDFDGIVRNHDCNSLLVPSGPLSLDDGCQKNEFPWLAASQTPADLSIEVEDVTFNVHKHPLTSKCGYIRQLDIQPSISNSRYDLKLENFPGGREAFQIILKFCYGLPVDLNSKNVAALRCASEYLEMTEELEDGNLISKTEAFLTFVVLSSWGDTITVLKSCEILSPWAENLQIVRRCSDSIAWKASRDRPSTGDSTSDELWWFDEVATLRIDYFTRFITAVRAKGTKPETIGKCIMHYAERSLPGMDLEFEGLRGRGHSNNELQFTILGRRSSKEQRTVIENLISILPPQQEAVSCQFLLKMLKMAILYSAASVLVSELEKRIGMMLEDANMHDLLIPGYRIAEQALPMHSPEHLMHDVDVVQRIIEYFLMHEHHHQQPQKSGKSYVSKLLDSYLAEVARDPNLSITKFQVLAESLPEDARSCHDGLYRAIDTYLKSHPSLSEHDRRRVCKIMNCQKLSVDACMHAAQNDRLPLRTVIQVLLSEQVKMRTLMQEKESEQTGNYSENEGNQTSTDRDDKILRAELENVKAKMAGLQNDYTELQQEYERIRNKQNNASPWSMRWKKCRPSHHTKVPGDEMVGDQDVPNKVGCRASFISRRRSSIS